VDEIHKRYCGGDHLHVRKAIADHAALWAEFATSRGDSLNSLNQTCCDDWSAMASPSFSPSYDKHNAHANLAGELAAMHQGGVEKFWQEGGEFANADMSAMASNARSIYDVVRDSGFCAGAPTQSFMGRHRKTG